MHENKFIHGDCMNPINGIVTLEDNAFDWAICDIQYKLGASKPSKKTAGVRQKNGCVLNTKVSDNAASDWDKELMPIEYFEQLKRVSKKQIIWGVNYQEFNLPGGRLVWDKLNFSSDQYDCEIAYLSFTQRTDIVYYMWNGMMQGETASEDVRKALKQIGNKKLNEKRIHVTQKPEKLYEYMLWKYVKSGESILDTHVGSASSLKVYRRHGHPYLGYEKGEVEYKRAQKRLSAGIQANIFTPAAQVKTTQVTQTRIFEH